MKQKKILMLTSSDDMIWHFLIPHIQELQKRGNIVECACEKRGFWFDELRDKYGFVMHEINFGRKPWDKRNFTVFKSLKELQKQNNYDVIYCHQPVGGFFGRMLGKKFHIPVIYMAHGFHFFKGNNKLKNLLFRSIEKYASKYTDTIITINQEDFEAAKTFKAKKVYKVSGIGFDKNKYQCETKLKAQARKELGIKEEFVILTIAEFIKRKNYDTMLKTIAELKDENIKFIICGQGKEQKNIENQIKELGIEHCVKILGYRKEINNIIQASDIFFLASHQEGLTLSMIESMSYGLPIVTSNVRGNRDLVKNGENGFICNQNDYKTFANKIKLLKDDKDLREKFSNCSKIESKKFSIEQVKTELNKIYDELGI